MNEDVKTELTTLRVVLVGLVLISAILITGLSLRLNRFETEKKLLDCTQGLVELGMHRHHATGICAEIRR